MLPDHLNAYLDAFEFAHDAHQGQKRKYTNEPYIVHPVAVAAIVHRYGGDDDMIRAALLHDVVEDTPCTIADIELAFGEAVAELVADLTDISIPSDGNRAVRKSIDRKHTATACERAKFVKLADLMHNTYSIVEHDKKFARTYLREKSLLLDVLKTPLNKKLWEDVNTQLNDSMYRVFD